MITPIQIQQIKDLVQLTIAPAIFEDFNVSCQEEVDEIISMISSELLTTQIIFIAEENED